MRHDRRIMVDIDDARIRIDRTGHLMDAPIGRQAGADVEELPDAPLSQKPDGAAQES